VTGARTLTGITPALWLVLRRDRVRLLVWVAAIVIVVWVSAASTSALYDTPESRRDYAALAQDNTTIIVQAGPGYGLDDPTTGAVLMNELGLWTFIAVALMSVFMVTRHTRAEEESGRAELVRAATVGRHAPAAAALIGVLIANLAIAMTVAAVLMALNLPVAGSVAFAASIIGIGMAFAGIALVAGQVAVSARAANGLAASVLALSFILRAVGDVGDGRLSWLSPIGWAQAIRAYADERWWVLLLPLVITIVLVLVADLLTSHRDLGGGLRQERPGRETAPPSLGSAFGLALRLQRAGLVGWMAGLAVVGAFYGAVATEAEQLLADTPELADFFLADGQRSITDAFLGTAMLMLGLIGSGFTISAVLRLRGEETEGRADTLLSTPLPRHRWMASHLVIAVAGSMVLMLVSGLSTGLGFGVVSGDWSYVGSTILAGLGVVPALLVLGGITAALFGVLPRWTLVAWAALAVAVLASLLGDLLNLPQALVDVSPFAHVPALPGGAVEPAATVVLVVLAAVAAAVGLSGIGRRDMA
jgi:ABC-2 type transport system permease protein